MARINIYNKNLVVLLKSSKKTLIDSFLHMFSQISAYSKVSIKFNGHQNVIKSPMNELPFFNKIKQEIQTFFNNQSIDLNIYVIIEESYNNALDDIEKLEKSLNQSGEKILFGMLITDYTGNNEYGSNYRLIENDIDRFFAGMSRRNIEWLRTSYSVLVYNDKYPVDNDLYHPSLRFAYRIFEPENDPIISDLAIQFMNFIQFNYLNKRSLKRFGEQKLITLGVEISNFLSNISPNWDFYYFTGSVISNLIDTFEKLRSSLPTGYCIAGPNEHSLACGAMANWQLYQRPFVITITSGMGDEFKGTLANLIETCARGFFIIAESQSGSWYPFQGTNSNGNDMATVMRSRGLLVVELQDPDKLSDYLEDAFNKYWENRGPVILLATRQVMTRTRKLEKTINIINPSVKSAIKPTCEDSIEKIVDILNHQKCRIVWQCGRLTPEEYQLVIEIAQAAGIALVDSITRPGTVSKYHNGKLNPNYLGTLALYGFSKRVYRYMHEDDQLLSKDKLAIFFLKSKINQINTPFSEATLKNKIRVVQINKNKDHLAPFAMIASHMRLLDFLRVANKKLEIDPEVKKYRETALANCKEEKDTFLKYLPILPMQPNYFFNKLNSLITNLIEADNYNYTGIYDVGRSSISAFRNVVRTGPGFSGWYGRALMGDGLLSVISLALTSNDNIIAFVGDGAKAQVPDIKATLIENIVHHRKKYDKNITIFFFVNGMYSLINTYQELFMNYRGRRQMKRVSLLEGNLNRQFGDITLSQRIINKFEPDFIKKSLTNKNQINYFDVIINHNNSGDGMSFVTLPSW